MRSRAVGHEDHLQDHLPEPTVVELPPYASHKIEVVIAA
jgi:hypothetical protein